MVSEWKLGVSTSFPVHHIILGTNYFVMLELVVMKDIITLLHNIA